MSGWMRMDIVIGIDLAPARHPPLPCIDKNGCM